jgi:hypothetical protein
LGSFLGKNIDCKEVPFFIHIDKINYLAQKAENFINVSRTHAGQNEKRFVKIFIGS